jgi:hypothetical protein
MFNQFLTWLFDGKKNSKIPEELLSYKSPITHTYVISLFTKIGPLNHFLNEYFNNVGVYYLDKKDLFNYIKECVQNFKISNRQIRYAWFGRKSNLYQALSKRHLNLKEYEILTLCRIVDSLEDRNLIYSSLGLKKPKISKSKNIKISKPEPIPIKSFISKNFILERS